MVKEQQPRQNETLGIGGMVIEIPRETAVTKDGYDLVMYEKIKARAVGGIPELQDKDLRQKVEEELQAMLGALTPSSANGLMALAWDHPTETNSMIDGFVDNVKNAEEQK
jgi:hypothetical protein